MYTQVDYHTEYTLFFHLVKYIYILIIYDDT